MPANVKGFIWPRKDVDVFRFHVGAGHAPISVTLSAVRDRHWHTDLYDVDGGRQTTTHVVTIRFGRWANAPTRSGPPSRRGVVNPLNPIVAFSSDN